MKGIVFRIGEESRPVIESKMDGSIFIEQYRKTFAEIEFYLQKNASMEKNNVVAGRSMESNNEYNNNIFAFTGERGTGKTSCMLSVANMLLRKDHVDQNDSEDLSKCNHIRECTFQTIDLIDPSYFDNKHNIIAILVAKLFKKVKDDIGETNCRDFEKRRRLVDCFSKAQKHLQCLLSGKDDMDLDDLNKLVNLSAAVDLKNTLYNLIETYLEYNKKDKKRQVMLFMVDDIDLNTSEACEMAEQIRKYLILPNVVILLSIKHEQLGRLKWQQYAIAYKELLDREQMSTSLVGEMVERYLTKLLPYNHRIYMPDFNAYAYSPLTVYVDDKCDNFSSVRLAVPELIYRKTRYLFYNSAVHTSYVVPQNLRSLRLLVALLYGMEDKESVIMYNKSLFKNYFFGTWSLDNLSFSDQSLINDLLQTDDYAQINKQVLDILYNRFQLKSIFPDDKSLLNRDGFFKELYYLTKTDNVVYNISAGDVLSLIWQLEKRYSLQKDMKFLFALKTFYSIRIYESYIEKVHALEAKGESKEDDSERILSNDVLYGISNFDRLIAGNYFNCIYDELLPQEVNKDSRSYRVINLEKLNYYINECVEKWDETDRETIRMVEFFMLSTARSFDSKNDVQFEYDYRKKQEVRYSETFNKVSQKAFFDANASLYNITRVRDCYGRFASGEAFYEKANAEIYNNRNECKSLWACFKNETITRYNRVKFNEGDWLYWCTIRNTEVLQNLRDVLFIKKYSDSDARSIFSKYFTEIARFSINSYDIDKETGKPYAISLDFMENLARLFKNPDEKFIEIFDSIYNIADNSDVLDVNKIVKSLRKAPDNLVNNLIKRIQRQYPIFASESSYRRILIRAFADKPSRLSREDIRIILEDINVSVEEMKKMKEQKK